MVTRQCSARVLRQLVELSILESSKFELIIDLKAAKVLGVGVLAKVLSLWTGWSNRQLDNAKSVFQVHGADTSSQVMMRHG
jgi:hypothetical protein